MNSNSDKRNPEELLSEDQTANIESSFEHSVPLDTEQKQADPTIHPEAESEQDVHASEQHTFDERLVNDGQELHDDNASRIQENDASLNPDADEFLDEQADVSTDQPPSVDRSEMPSLSIAPSGEWTEIDKESQPVKKSNASNKPRLQPIGRYEVRKLLGQGAFGKVYQAYDPQLDRMVAVKVSKEITEKKAINRFLREARAAASLRHPAIVPVYEYGQLEELSMIVYELIEGQSLRAYMNRNYPLPMLKNVAMIRKIAEGLDYAHNRGIVHRDMKPDNILIDRNDEPHVTDFGCARKFDDDQKNQTLDGSILGTPAYMSPEQAAGNSNKVDGRSDVWSLGIMLYEMISGTKPYQGKLSEILDGIRHRDPKPLRKVFPKTPRDIDTICHRCLQRDPNFRFASAGELVEELERFERGEPIKSRRISVLTRTWLWARRNPGVAAMLSIVILSLTTATIISSWSLSASESAHRKNAKAMLNQIKSADSKSLSSLNEVIQNKQDSLFSYLLSDLKNECKNSTGKQRIRVNTARLFLGDADTENIVDQFLVDLELAGAAEICEFCKAAKSYRSHGKKSVSLDEKLIEQLIAYVDNERAIQIDHRASNKEIGSANVLRAIGALAQLKPEKIKWSDDNLSREITGQIASIPLAKVSPWLETIQPIFPNLKDEFEQRFRGSSHFDNNTSQVTAFVLSHFLIENDPDQSLVRIIEHSSSLQLSIIFENLNSNSIPISLPNHLKLQLEKYETIDTENRKQLRAKSNLIAALMRFRDFSQYWDNLTFKSDNSLRTELIEKTHEVTSTLEPLNQKLRAWHEEPPGIIAGILLSLSEFNEIQIPISSREQYYLPILKDIFSSHKKASVHSACRWLLSKWNLDEHIDAIEKSKRRALPEPDFDWHVDNNGITFVIFEADDDLNAELIEDIQVSFGKRHRFGLAIHEVTQAEFRKFIDEAGALGGETFQSFEAQPDSREPVTSVYFSWAVGYTKWLTAKNQLQDVVSFIELPDLLNSIGPYIDKFEERIDTKGFAAYKSGYRLPTRKEWEFACSSSTTTIRPFGNNEKRLREYAWFEENSNHSLQQIGTRKPTESGLFDMLGNANEWQLGRLMDRDINDNLLIEVCGGAYSDIAMHLRAKKDPERAPAERITKSNETIGFRLARTYPVEEK